MTTRRRLLGTVALSAVAVAGCQDETTAVSPDPDDPVLCIVQNKSDMTQTVDLTLTREETAVLDTSVTLDAGNTAEYDPGIDTPGSYELTVDVDGGSTRTLSLTIEPYDVEHGSNHTVTIQPASIQITWEE